MKSEKSRARYQSAFDSSLFAFRDSLLALFYPQVCRLCEKSVESKTDGAVCRRCWRRTKIFTGAEILCDKCGAFLRDGQSEYETYCRRCDADFYDQARAVGFYEKALLISVLNLKREPHIPQTLANLFYKAFLDSPFRDATRIVPVPLSKKRFSERGFNQAQLLAESLAESAQLPVDAGNLVRRFHSPKHRAGMDKKARAETVSDVFEITKPRLIEGERILLIDDVFTSGATVSNCAKILKEKGANKVYVLTVARAN